jgi:hypothetical protein
MTDLWEIFIAFVSLCSRFLQVRKKKSCWPLWFLLLASWPFSCEISFLVCPGRKSPCINWSYYFSQAVAWAYCPLIMHVERVRVCVSVCVQTPCAFEYESFKMYVSIKYYCVSSLESFGVIWSLPLITHASLFFFFLACPIHTASAATSEIR